MQAMYGKIRRRRLSSVQPTIRKGLSDGGEARPALRNGSHGGGPREESVECDPLTVVAPTRRAAPCPACDQKSARRRSEYTRTLMGASPVPRSPDRSAFGQARDDRRKLLGIVIEDGEIGDAEKLPQGHQILGDLRKATHEEVGGGED